MQCIIIPAKPIHYSSFYVPYTPQHAHTTTMKLLLLALALATTAQAQITDAPDDKRIPPGSDQLALISGHTPLGTWGGSLPCADCKAIRYRLTINADSTYKETLVYEGKSEREFDQLGRWYITGDTLLRLRKDPGEGNDRFVMEAGRLTALDQENRRITGTLAERYVLTPAAPTTQMGDDDDIAERDQALVRNGIEFIAIGQQPAWSAQLKGKTVSVMVAGKKSLLLPVKRRTTSKAGHTTLSLQQGKLNALLTYQEGDCQDAATAERFTHQATLTGIGKPLKGCGKFLKMEGIAALKGRWVFDSIAGAKAEAGKQIAFIEFNPDGSYTGNTSCNSMRGKYTLSGSSLALVAPITTRIACQGQGEATLLQAIERVASYRLRASTLHLMGADGVVAATLRR